MGLARVGVLMSDVFAAVWQPGKEKKVNVKRIQLQGMWCATIVALVLIHAGSALAQTERYVAPGGSDSNGGTGWNDAFATISNAVALASAGDTVVISNGTYNTTAELVIGKAITLISYGNGVTGGLANAELTIIDRGASDNSRVVSLTDPGAVLAGLTITGGNTYANTHGAGIWMSGGTVSNCIVSGNRTPEKANGVGIYASGGTVTHSIITDNYISDADGFQVYGGGIYADGASVLIRNCLIARNTDGYPSGGYAASAGGVYLNNGTIESCTIVSNSAASSAGGVYRASGTVSNSIIYYNTLDGSPDDLSTTVGVTYTCASDGNTSDGNITAAPLFVDLAGSDYRLQASSPCIDKGSNQGWMTGATDLVGKDRIQQSIVDMGAYEWLISGSIFRFR